MRKYLTPFVVLVVLTVYGGLHITRKSVIRTDTLADEYAVYTAVIHEMFAGNRVTFDSQANVKLLVIRDHTACERFSLGEGDEIQRYLWEAFPSASQETVDSYIEKNKEKQLLKDSFDLKMK